jgi:hypothetical protein
MLQHYPFFSPLLQCRFVLLLRNLLLLPAGL